LRSNTFFMASLFVSFGMVNAFSAEKQVPAAVYNGASTHIVVSLPAGVGYTCTVDEERKRVCFLFPSLSLVELSTHCLMRSPYDSSLAVPLFMGGTEQGATLECDISALKKPLVTVGWCEAFLQLVIGIHENRGARKRAKMLAHFALGDPLLRA